MERFLNGCVVGNYFVDLKTLLLKKSDIQNGFALDEISYIKVDDDLIISICLFDFEELFSYLEHLYYNSSNPKFFVKLYYYLFAENSRLYNGYFDVY